MKVGLISLGCSKNLVDSEMMLGLVKEFGAVIVNETSEADIVIINTCGFIEAAKQEAIDTILETSEELKNGAKLIVTGCLATRYVNELKEELPEVDLWLTLKDYDKFGEYLSQFFDKKIDKGLDFNNRLLTTKSHYAYLKISDGCNHRCHYCAIPLIRGKFKSRPLEDILVEARYLVGKGIKELVIISQDTTNYGIDLATRSSLSELLTELNKINDLKHIRFLYTYPALVKDELIDTVKNLDKVVPYFDLPCQHGSDKILKSMNRADTKEKMLSLVNKIRTNIPEAVLRTTIIVGYPGETEEDFLDLLEFIKEAKFDRLGAFTYSIEEDTVAATFENQIAEKVKQDRLEILMKTQEEIAYQQNQRFVGMETEVVVESYDEDLQMYQARNYAYAPDDIDGYIYVNADNLEISTYLNVKIVRSDLYNLYAEVI